MKIKYILNAINSKRDQSGNCYWAMQFTDCETGTQVHGTISGGESNIVAIMHDWHGGSYEPHDFYYTRHEYSKREFGRLTADWPYAGCAPTDLVKFICKSMKQTQNENV